MASYTEVNTIGAGEMGLENRIDKSLKRLALPLLGFYVKLSGFYFSVFQVSQEFFVVSVSREFSHCVLLWIGYSHLDIGNFCPVDYSKYLKERTRFVPTSADKAANDLRHGSQATTRLELGDCAAIRRIRCGMGDSESAFIDSGIPDFGEERKSA